MFYAFICLVFFMLLFWGGLFLCLVPNAPQWVLYLIDLLQQKPQTLYFIGIPLVILGLFSFILFYMMNRKVFYSVNITPELDFSIRPKIVQTVISDFLKQYPKTSHLLPTIDVSKSEIHVGLDLSNISLKNHEEVLISLEKDLNQLIKDRFKTPKNIILNIEAKKI